MPRPKLSLSKVFRPESLYATWKKRLWTAVRQQKFPDLLEYYDYNRNIGVHARRLCPLVVSGNFKPSAPLLLEVGKADQLVRRLQIPHPDDAVVLQAIAEAFLPFVKKEQKTANAYFSRTHSAKKGIHTGHMPLDYPWFVLWPRYQRKILDFSKARQYLVSTDIQNFFDSLSHDIIRRALTAIDPRHTLTDLTLYLLESYCRRELYGPQNNRGIPQLDFDAPGLLAHLVLFPVDEYLNRGTQGSFTRWVDDINFAADTKQGARVLLRGLERKLIALDLRLGGSKTVILDRDSSERYLQVEENRKVDEFRRIIQAEADTKETYEQIVETFSEHRHAARYGQWDKVLMRYYNLFGDSKLIRTPRAFAGLFRRVELASHEDFLNMFDHRFRLTIVRFWAKLRPTKHRVSRIMQYIRGMSKYDDVVTLALANVLLAWALPPSSTKVALRFQSIDDRRPGGFAARLLLLAKYGTDKMISDFILESEGYWSSSEFLARQVIATWSLLSPAGALGKSLEARLSRKLLRSVNDLFDFVHGLRSTARLDLSLWGYLSPVKMKRPYSLSKAIVASNVLRSSQLIDSDRKRLMAEITKLVHDPRLRAIALNKAHP
jgi:hypothetical protein